MTDEDYYDFKNSWLSNKYEIIRPDDVYTALESDINYYQSRITEGIKNVESLNKNKGFNYLNLLLFCIPTVADDIKILKSLEEKLETIKDNK